MNGGSPVTGDGTTKISTFNLSGLAEFFRCTVQY
jgi:hypothetical protein